MKNRTKKTSADKAVNSMIWMKFLRAFSLKSVVFSVFFFSKGLSVADLALYYSVYKIVQAGVEIPLGIFADKYGLKTSLQLSILMEAAHLLFLTFGGGMFAMMLAAISGGLSSALYSDTDNSIAYRELEAEDREKEYPKYTARKNAAGFIAYGAGAMIGSVMVALGIPVVVNILLGIPVAVAHLVMAARLPKSTNRVVMRNENSVAALKNSWNYMRKNRSLIKIATFNSLLCVVNLFAWDYYQAYGLEIGMPVVIFGVMVVIFSAAEAVPQFLSDRYIKTRGFSKMYIGLLAAAAGCVALGGALGNQTGFMFLILAVAITGFSFPITSAIVHKFADKNHRATICSFITTAEIGSYGLASLVMSRLAENSDLFHALSWISVTILILVGSYALLRVMRKSPAFSTLVRRRIEQEGDRG